MHTPVCGRTELEAIDDDVLDEPIAVQVFHERHPRQVGGAEAADEGVRQLRLQIGLLDVDLRLAVVGDVVEVARDVHGPDVVEVMRRAEVEALDVDASTIGRGLHAIVLQIDVGKVREHLAADHGGLAAVRERGAGDGDREQGGYGGNEGFHVH